jgi:hypothetical protein
MILGVTMKPAFFVTLSEAKGLFIFHEILHCVQNDK